MGEGQNASDVKILFKDHFKYHVISSATDLDHSGFSLAKSECLVDSKNFCVRGGKSRQQILHYTHS